MEGSSGVLRRELGVQPPGDIRNCLAALATEEPLNKRPFQYRFPREVDLKDIVLETFSFLH